MRHAAIAFFLACAACGDSFETGDGSSGDASGDASDDVTTDAAADSSRDAADAEGGTTLPVLHDLKLWLTADRGATCDGSQVTAWKDLSGHGDAKSNLHAGPSCKPDAQHALAGTQIPFFDRPSTANAADGTLDVDLSFLVGAYYTVGVVSRLWAPVDDRLAGLLGAALPATPSGCPGSIEDRTSFAIGFWNAWNVSSDAGALGVDHVCANAFVPASAQAIPAPWQTIIVRFGPGNGGPATAILVEGAEITAGTTFDLAPLTSIAQGAIGRAYFPAFDGRFEGDIAEVVVFDKPLGNAEVALLHPYFKRHWGL